MLIAIKITPETHRLVSDLAHGKILHAEVDEMTDTSPAYYLYDEQSPAESRFVSEKVYKENYDRTNLTMFFPIVREI